MKHLLQPCSCCQFKVVSFSGPVAVIQARAGASAMALSWFKVKGLVPAVCPLEAYERIQGEECPSKLSIAVENLRRLEGSP